MVKQYRKFTWTANNYQNNMMEDYNVGDYSIYGEETAPTTGKKHLQGFTYFKEKKSTAQVLAMFPKGIHLEVSKGSIPENIVYCQKDGGYHEHGKRPQQGKRNDLHVIQNDLKFGKKNDEQVADEYFSQWVYHRHAFREYAAMKNKFNTLLVIYDRRDTKQLLKAGKYMRCRNSLVVDLPLISEVLMAYASGKYEYVVVPYFAELSDAIEEVDGSDEEINYLRL